MLYKDVNASKDINNGSYNSNNDNNNNNNMNLLRVPTSVGGSGSHDTSGRLPNLARTTPAVLVGA